MPKQSSKTKRPRRDEVQAAYAVIQHVIQQTEGQPGAPTATDGKNPAAVALGRLGGLKGGKARAEKLPEARRIAIARKAAKTRWDKRRTPARQR